MSGRLYPDNFEGQAPKEFGIGANILKTRTFALDNARDLEQIDIGGSCIWAIAATSLGAEIDVRVNDQLRDPVTFQQGMFIRGIPFSRLYVSHDAQAGETITIFFAKEQDVKNIEVVNPAIAFTEINLTKSTLFADAVDVVIGAAAQGTLLAANANRRTAYITSLSTNVHTVRVGTWGVGAARGMALAPGETLAIDTTYLIMAYNPGGIGQTFGVSWTED